MWWIWTIVAVVILGLMGFLVYASASISSGVYVKALCHGKTDQPVVALTFDDGPDENMTPKVLEVLRRHGVRATFFLVGEKAARNPETVRQILNEGHLIGNHTWSHSPFFPTWSFTKVEKELAGTEKVVEEITGKRMKLFRPPFGVTNPVIGRAVRHKEYVAVGWSVRSLDTDLKCSREAVCRRVMDRMHNGAVVLLHDRLPEADRLLEMILQNLEKSGMRVVGTDELLEFHAYED